MFFDKLAKNFSKDLKWYEVSLLKLCVVFCTLFLITVWPALGNVVLSVAWYWYLMIAIILAIPLVKKLY